MDPSLAWLQALILTTLFAAVLTTLASPLLIALYRKRVTDGMGRVAPMAGNVSVAVDPPAVVTAPSVAPPVALMEADLGKGDEAPKGSDALCALVAAKRRRAVLAYAASGLALALLLTVAFAIHHAAVISFTAALAAYAMFASPVVPTVLHLVSASRALQFLGAGAAVVVILLLLGIAYDQVWIRTVFWLHVLVPMLLFAVFNLRFWRGVAPMTFLLLAAASLGWVSGFVLASKILGVFGPVLWVFRFGGFGIGLCLGYCALGWISKRYAKKAIGDQELFLDTWWLLYTVVQTIVFTATSESPLYLAILANFVVFRAVKARIMRPMAQLYAGRRPLRLLLLRVFDYDKRTEALFERLSLTWLWIGSIYLIAGRDLALRNIGPVDFLAFLSGRLAAQFVRDESECSARLAALDDHPDPEGRYRVNQFFCHDNTWRPTMRALAARSDVVLMDLRGFDGKREGCCYELRQLARQTPPKPVILLADAKTKLDAVQALVCADPTRHHTGSGSNCIRWLLVHAPSSAGDPGSRLFALLVSRLDTVPTGP